MGCGGAANDFGAPSFYILSLSVVLVPMISYNYLWVDMDFGPR